MKSDNKGIFCISLDFEMMWGAKDWSTPQEYGKSNIAQVPQVINRLLKLFLKYDIHATFATVGFIFCRSKEDLLEHLPSKKPSYRDANLSPYSDNYIENITKEYEKLYFAPELVHKINETPGMEVATHTACHYNCTAPGQTPEEFKEDIVVAKNLAKRMNIDFNSIVFPRNQVDNVYLRICEKMDIFIYRGNALRFYNKTKNRLQAIKNRICRFLDNYIPLDQTTLYSRSQVKEGKMYNVRASRILRPYSSKLSFLEEFRYLRIKNEITKAAKEGKIYHLWWHPHNFGSNIDKNFRFLEKILIHYKYCNNKYGMLSMNIKEVAKISNSY